MQPAGVHPYLPIGKETSVDQDASPIRSSREGVLLANARRGATLANSRMWGPGPPNAAGEERGAVKRVDNRRHASPRLPKGVFQWGLTYGSQAQSLEPIFSTYRCALLRLNRPCRMRLIKWGERNSPALRLVLPALLCGRARASAARGA